MKRRYYLCEGTTPDNMKPIKGMTFNSYEVARKIADRLASIHTDCRYGVYDVENNRISIILYE